MPVLEFEQVNAVKLVLYFLVDFLVLLQPFLVLFPGCDLQLSDLVQEITLMVILAFNQLQYANGVYQVLLDPVDVAYFVYYPTPFWGVIGLEYLIEDDNPFGLFEFGEVIRFFILLGHCDQLQQLHKLLDYALETSIGVLKVIKDFGDYLQKLSFLLLAYQRNYFL